MRTTWWLALSVVAITALAACAPSYRASDVKTVTISTTICYAACQPAHAAFSSDGTIAYGAGNPIVRSSPTFVRRFLAQMPIEAMIELARHPSGMSGTHDMGTLYMRDGTSFTAIVPAATVDSRDANPIQNWLVRTAVMARAIAMRDRERLIMRAVRDGKAFAGTRFQMDGCFGTCPAYIVWFSSSGTATYDAQRTRLSHAIHATASIPADRVREALAQGGAAALEPYYPPIEADYLGATIDIVVNGKHYTSNGPDSSTWSPEFRSTVARLDQLVVDTRWTPALPERKP